MIKVDVRLLASLEIGRFNNRLIQLEEPATIHSLLDTIELTPWHIGAVSVNSKASNFEHPLDDGDRVTLMSDIVGG
ncbi:MoaD/ThiS family protein [Desulfosediminicola ganghwensis]|uniref:MoaD/ThiS family protein n=1 Tax=Desulfosediminicola ganghwensis TaxID=2569540 RepID=UPI0010AD4FE5|nr:MoaD/ThiS family protein [Desulfosediminicola ganghwensis]